MQEEPVQIHTGSERIDPRLFIEETGKTGTGADAESIINLAQSDRARLVSDVAAQAQRFEEILPQYRRHPALFEQQRLTETLGKVLTNVQDKIFLAESPNGKPKQLRLLLNRELPKPKAEETKP